MRGLFEFPVDFVGVVVEAQSVDVRVGGFGVGDLLAGEIRRETALPKLVLALDFAFGLGRWSIKEANVVKPEGPAKLGQGLRGFGEEDAVVVDVELEGATVGEKGGWEKVEIGQESFAVVDF